jgi:predicted phage tail component-like protein
MAIMESIYFSYDGEYSVNYGIYNVSVSNGMYEEQFLSRRSILETRIKGNDKPYFGGIEYEPLVLKLTFAFENTWDDDLIRKVARWLNQSYYKPLFFSDNIDRIFYCIATDDISLIHNGLKQGYVTLTMRCDSPYAYSRTILDSWSDYSANTVDGIAHEFNNMGDVNIKPELWIQKVGNGDVTIKNLTNGGQIFKFTGLLNGETVYVDNDREYIESSLPNTYRYDAFNNEYLDIVVGRNILQIYGNIKINFRYQFKVLQ